MRKHKMDLLAVAFVAICLLCACSRTPIPCELESIQKEFDPQYFQNHTIIIDGFEQVENVIILGELLSLSEWEEAKKPTLDEEELIKIHLSEEYEIIIYESYASVYYGYNSLGETDNVCYSVPDSTIDKIRQYVDACKISLGLYGNKND